MNKAEFVSGSSIRTKYGISTLSLHRWEEKGKVRTVRTPGGHRLYQRQDIETIFGKEGSITTKKKVCYARVSSEKQRPDLERQINDLKEAKPNYELFSDIGSGINYKRRNFQRLLEQILRGDIEEVVVTRKDRLCRFASDLLEFIFQKTQTRLVVLYSNADTDDNAQELAEDLLAITTVFVARNNGLQSAQNRKRRREAEERIEEERARIIEEDTRTSEKEEED